MSDFPRRILEQFNKPAAEHDSEAFDKLLLELHRADIPDPEKLKDKDQTLVDLTAALNRFIQKQLRLRNLTATEAEAFDKIVKILKVIETILWELKHLPGDPPKPGPYPPDEK